MSEIKEEASSAPDGADEMRNPENVAQEWAAGRISSSSLDQWPSIRTYLQEKINQNLDAFDVRAKPSLHTAAPLAPILREQEEHSSSQSDSPPPTTAAIELIASEHDIGKEDMEDFYPARVIPPSETWLTWDQVLDGDDLQAAKDQLFSMLNDFDQAPPFTIQRFCELVCTPTKHYHTRSKYLHALQRILSVTSTAVPTTPKEGSTVNGTMSPLPADEPASTPSFHIRPSSEVTPMYSPIPFLDTNGGDAVTDANGTPTVPAGRIDELDSSAAHGVVTESVQPLSATTTVEDSPKRLRVD